MASAGKREKILILESDLIFGEQIAAALRSKGYEVSMVNSGDGALKAIQNVLPHLVLLDASVHGADGYEILEKKQGDPMVAKIPVFLLSTEDSPINMKRVAQKRVTEFFTSLHIAAPEIVRRVDAFFGHDKPVQQAEPTSIGGKKKLMWVEDDKLIGTILSKKLVSSGFDLFHAKNGEEALEMIKSVTPDAIVLDLVLPNMSGFEILDAIKKDLKTAKIPIMILSNLSKQNDIDRAKALGAERFLVKASVSLDQIVREVRGLCK